MSLFDQQLDQHQLDSLYNWVDNLPLSKPKKNISRDYSDAVLMAETINYYYPKFVQLHNYPATNSIKSKFANWKTLNMKVLNKFGINLRDQECQRLASATPMMIQVLLHEFKNICVQQNRQKQAQSMQNAQPVSHQQTYGNIKNQEAMVEKGREGGNQEKNRKKQMDAKGIQVTKAEQLKQILKILKQKIGNLQRNIQRKDAEIKQLQDIIQLGL